MKKVLLTGVKSRIGKSFVTYINENDSEIVTDQVSLRTSDYRNMDWSCYQCILHVAGITGTDTRKLTQEQKDEYYIVNSDLTYEIAQKAKQEGVRHFIFLSTMMVYGDAAPIGQRFVIDKTTTPNPQSVYGESKLLAEKRISELASDSFKVLIIREPVIYGESFDSVFNKLQIIAARIVVFPNIDSCKSHIYERNLCELFKLAIERELTGIICPQNKECISMSSIYYAMRRSYNKKCYLLKGFKWILTLLSPVCKYVNYVFGNICYDEELSVIEGINYQKYNLEESLKLINAEKMK